MAFVDIKGGGEKYIYPKVICEWFRKQDWVVDGKDVGKYDVMCSFVPYMRSRGFEGDLPHVKSIPVVHSLSHRKECQINYGPYWCLGNGLDGGEYIEVLWSLLNPIFPRIREMSHAYRRETLELHLEYIAQSRMEDIENILLTQMKNSFLFYDQASHVLDGIISTNPINLFTPAIVETWKRSFISSSENQIGELVIPWQEEYAFLLNQYFSICRETTTFNSEPLLQQKKSTLNNNIKKMERKYGILSRWISSSQDFKQWKRTYLERRIQTHLVSLDSAVKTMKFWKLRKVNQGHG